MVLVCQVKFRRSLEPQARRQRRSGSQRQSISHHNRAGERRIPSVRPVRIQLTVSGIQRAGIVAAKRHDGNQLGREKTTPVATAATHSHIASVALPISRLAPFGSLRCVKQWRRRSSWKAALGFWKLTVISASGDKTTEVLSRFAIWLIKMSSSPLWRLSEREKPFASKNVLRR